MSDKQSGSLSSRLPSNLTTQILNEIGSGTNEGDILDMQIRNELDPLQPHLYQHPDSTESAAAPTGQQTHEGMVHTKEGIIKKIMMKKGAKEEEKEKGVVNFDENLGALIDE